jgi:hypothetical protein
VISIMFVLTGFDRHVCRHSHTLCEHCVNGGMTEVFFCQFDAQIVD